MLENLEPPKKNFTCRIRTIMSELEPKDAKILAEALSDPISWQANTLSKALKQRGIQVGQESIRRHRDGSCSC